MKIIPLLLVFLPLLAGCNPEATSPPPASQPAAAAPAPGQAVLRFEITGMHCDGCANGLTAELRQTPGVSAAVVTFSNQLAVVTCDTNRLSPDRIAKVVKEAGFTAKQIQP